MKWIYRRVMLLGVACVLCVAMAGMAEGDIVNFSVSSSPDVIFDIHLEYDSGLISVDILNRATNYEGASITGLAFNLPVSGLSLASFLADPDLVSGHPSGFGGKLRDGGIKDGPYGLFDIGVSNNWKWSKPDSKWALSINGGKPQSGVWTGETATFEFLVSGEGIEGLSAASIFGELSEAGSRETPFVVRWQDRIADRSGFAVVPLPGSLLLCGIGLGFVGVVRRIRRKS